MQRWRTPMNNRGDPGSERFAFNAAASELGKKGKRRGQNHSKSTPLGSEFQNERALCFLSKSTCKCPKTQKRGVESNRKRLLDIRQDRRRFLLQAPLGTGIKQPEIYAHTINYTCTWGHIPLLHFSKTFLCSRTSEFKASFSCFTLFT